MPEHKLSLNDPLTRILLVSLGIAIATYFAVQNFVLTPRKARVLKLTEQLQLSNLRDETAKIYERVAEYEKTMPKQKDAGWLLAQTGTMAKVLDLDLDSVEPLPIKQIPPYSYVPFKIKTSASYETLVNLIGLIEQSPYVLSVESVRLKAKDISTPEGTRQERPRGIPVYAYAQDDPSGKAVADIEMVFGVMY